MVDVQPKTSNQSRSSGWRDLRRRIRSAGRYGRWSAVAHSIGRYRWLSLAVAWLVCILGWSLIALWPNTYRSSAVLFAATEHLAELPAFAGIRDGGVAVVTLGRALMPDDSLEQVRSTVNLQAEEMASLKQDLMIRPAAPPVFVISYDHANPLTSQQVLNSLLNSFMAKTLVADTSELDAEIELKRSQLDAAAAGLEEFRRANADQLSGGDRLSDQLRRLQEEQERLRQEIAEQSAAQDALTARLAAAQQADADARAAAAAAEGSTQEMAALQEELANLQVRYAETHPYVVAVRDAIAELQRRQAVPQPQAPAQSPAAVEAERQQLTATLAELNARLAANQGEVDRLQGLAETAPGVEAELARLERDYQTVQAELDTLLSTQDGTGQQDVTEATKASFRVINAPSLPTKPTGPPRLLCLIAVLLSGMLLGALIPVLKTHYRGVFENAWQLHQRFDVSVLGTMSNVLAPVERRRLGAARLAFGIGCMALFGLFGGLAIAESLNLLAPWAAQVRTEMLG